MRAGSLLLAGLGCCLALRAADADSTPAPVTVKASTGRGEFDVLVYASTGASAAAPAPAPPPGMTCANPLVLFISGEGGWRKFDELLVGFLSQAGYPVAGVDATKYFWDAQDDRAAAAGDFRSIASAASLAAGCRQDAPLILAGFSFGADLAPWLAGDGGWNRRLRGLVMIGPDETGSLQFRFTELLGFQPADHIFPVAEALKSAAGIPILFVHGEKDPSSAAPLLASRAGDPKKLLLVAGANHHFSGREEQLRKALLEGIEWILSY